jgi:hypothetical protein
MPGAVPRRPDQHNHAAVQIPGCDETVLTVVTSDILVGRHLAHEHQPGIGEVQSPFLQGFGPLGSIASSSACRSIAPCAAVPPTAFACPFDLGMD